MALLPSANNDRETRRGKQLRLAYKEAVVAVRLRENLKCEACGASARHTHHIHRVSDTSLHSVMFSDPANLMLLCDECHGLMHPLLRGGPRWKTAREMRGRDLRRA